ncbi:MULTISPECIES: cysteine desulfurase SufS [Lonsdalea]|uniref:Cysteine sulfinate desulfinase n=2 Tax=Lonsdalea TaxID=1082702 RepID=A0ACD1JEZ7_9GAMM|nr:MULTISPECIES: cysteine desulfurase SufS [Lonsdalea]OSM99490.1 cysteine sulfinate desulfinase [Lonsdalea populi]OSN02741.1 cysteine sulfinate desulfinase [Lonsdalea populi]QPQ25496.1 cysteine desulfurase SufS [Lonsdalea populi]RAT15591.1 cysteine sulfinate desulfinase [Lonsdalea quercina]RAT18231.1 cysteine sulfinate desulfinase [Lonsdalea quercina]
MSDYPIARVRADFPILKQEVNGQSLVYLDSAASSQKPQSVIDRELNFYQNEYAAVHRGIHTLSARATTAMEDVRTLTASFINAESAEEIVFVRGTTEAINLVANSYGRTFMQPGDNVVITAMEHHANIVPWQMLAQTQGIEIRVLPLTAGGELDVVLLPELLDEHTRLVSVAHISNVLGTVNPVQDIVRLAHSVGAKVLLDGAQAIMHEPVDVHALNCDFYAFSGHKIYGPSGIGVLYGKQALLQAMPPWEGGGAMIREVSLTKGTTYADAPWRFEAGSPNTAGIMGLGAALDYVSAIGREAIHRYETDLMQYAVSALKTVPTLIMYGPEQRQGVIAFNLGQHHAYDVGSFLDQYGIAIRTGHHCAMPLMEHYGVSSMCRASLAVYTQREDIDRLVAGLQRIHGLLGG